jgi:hypothetical protein
LHLTCSHLAHTLFEPNVVSQTWHVLWMRIRIGFSIRYDSFSGRAGNGSTVSANRSASFRARSVSIWERSTFVAPSGTFVGSTSGVAASAVALSALGELV